MTSVALLGRFWPPPVPHMAGTRNNISYAVIRKQPPAAVSPHFIVRTLSAKDAPAVQVVVPVRIEPHAAKRNRIRRQVAEAFRAILKESSNRSHIVITVRKGDIPQGLALRKAVFELLQESGMIQQ